MEREVGGGIRMGNTCKPMAVSFQCMTKSTTNKKKFKKKDGTYTYITEYYSAIKECNFDICNNMDVLGGWYAK